jgi:hypothetical protein
MAEEHDTFESLLHKEFKWPKAGDTPFSASEHPQRNAYINRFGHGRLLHMMTGYKLAADILVEKAQTSQHSDRDVLVYPILFNYRHFIELSLKYLSPCMAQRSKSSPTGTRMTLPVFGSLFLKSSTRTAYLMNPPTQPFSKSSRTSQRLILGPLPIATLSTRAEKLSISATNNWI